MLIGAIESSSPDHVSGWIHSGAADVGGALLLAFLDQRCVGAGRVEIFRQDLADAGLGDGRRGFHFPIQVPRPEDALRVAVRLDLSEVYLLQREAVLDHGHMPRAYLGGELPDAARRDWMCRHGLMVAAQEQALAGLADFGVGLLPLGPATPEAAARALFEAVLMGPCELGERVIEGPLRPALFAPDSPARRAGLFALVAARRLGLRLAEGRPIPLGREDGPPDLTGAVNHRVDGQHLLLVRRWTPFDLPATRPADGLRVLFPAGAPA